MTGAINTGTAAKLLRCDRAYDSAGRGVYAVGSIRVGNFIARTCRASAGDANSTLVVLGTDTPRFAVNCHSVALATCARAGLRVWCY